MWVSKWIARRSSSGGEVLMQELALEERKSYTNALRMTPEKFDELLALVEGDIQRRDTHFQAALPARLKLEVTLRYLASGDSFKSLALLFRVPVSTISTFLPEVLRAIIIALQSFIQVTTTFVPVYVSIMYMSPLTNFMSVGARREGTMGSHCK